MPANIEGMVNQYSKIAQKTFDMYIDSYENRNKIITIPLGLQFVPKIIFLKANCKYSEFYFVKITKVGESFEIEYGYDTNYTFKITEITAENLKIKITSAQSTGATGNFREIVAIG